MKITFNKLQKSKTNFLGFTLVELIVVVTILVIIGTIAFTNFSGYTSSARDSKRVANLTSLYEGLGLFLVKSGSFPMPEGFMTITASGSIIAYQGFAKEQTETKANLSLGTTKDPLDPTIYTTYSVNIDQSKIQLMSFLEDGNTVSMYIPDFSPSSLISEAFASSNSNYTKRTPTTKGDALGILLSNTGTLLNMPVQERYNAGSFTGVDIVNTMTGYIAVFSKGNSVNGTGSVLSFGANMWAKSCNDLLSKDSNMKNKDGTYYINPTGTGSFPVYCDMTTDGGGWTLIVGINAADNAHDTGIAVTPLNLASLSGKGKLSDATINALRTATNSEGIVRLNCGQVDYFDYRVTPWHADYVGYPNGTGWDVYTQPWGVAPYTSGGTAYANQPGPWSYNSPSGNWGSVVIYGYSGWAGCYNSSCKYLTEWNYMDTLGLLAGN